MTPTLLERGAVPFFAYARARQEIMIRRACGESPPWTRDPVLSKYRFCNVFREDDRTTVWFREHVREKLTEEQQLFAAVTFRWFNRVTTGEVLVQHRLLEEWDSSLARSVLCNLHPLVTGAFVVKTPNGMSKLNGLVWCIEHVWARREELLAELTRHRPSGRALRAAHTLLRTLPFLGSFMAYEVVTDLRHTSLLDEASDIQTWAAMGPGAARGLARLLGLPLKHWNYTSPVAQEEMLAHARELLELSRDRRFWPEDWRQWEMRDIEHSLCEWDKFERARLGEGRPKQLLRV